jgi:cardiolipin synthase
MEWSWAGFMAVNYVCAFLAILSVLRQRKEPTSLLAWILAILAVPVLGILAYWLIGSNRLARRHRRRIRRIQGLVDRIQAWARRRAGVEAEPAALPGDQAGVARLAERLTHSPPTGGNEVQVYEDANETYAALEQAIQEARHHVHLEYYIWQPDETGRHFRDLLIEKARAGVRCRVLLDAVGSLGLPQAFLRPLRAAGVQVAFFLPLWRFRRRVTLNMRNHRKIAVCDGRCALLGSQNIGDEYRGWRAALSPWHDAHMLVRGPATLFLQQTFVEDWSMATQERLDSDEYFPEPVHAGESVVQVLATGPDQNVAPLEQVFFAAVSSARASIDLATPYFVPDREVRLLLQHACLRGVRVRLVLPTRTDVPVALWAARSFYGELIDAGIEIYEYPHGVLHSKIATVDNRWAILGSANMDVRSFRLNYEITALIYDEKIATRLGRSILGYCNRSHRITPRDAWRRNWREELREGAARLLVPLL